MRINLPSEYCNAQSGTNPLYEVLAFPPLLVVNIHQVPKDVFITLPTSILYLTTSTGVMHSFIFALLLSMGGSPGDVREEPVT